MAKIYRLNNAVGIYPCFLEQFKKLENCFYKKHSNWKNYNKNEIYELFLNANDNGKKNYQFDFSKIESLLIFSEKAVEVLHDILYSSGTFVNIKTPSKRKKFYGYYNNQKLYDRSIIDYSKTSCKNLSEYGQPNEYLYRYIVFNNNVPLNEPLFAFKEDSLEYYVNDYFKELVEKNNLIGFDFSDVAYDPEWFK